MKTNKLRLLGVAGIAASAFTIASPALAHDGRPYGPVYYGAPHFFYPYHRVVVVRPPVFVGPPVVVYRPGPVYYAPAPVYYAPAPVYYAPAPVYYAPAPVYYDAPAYQSSPAAATIGGAIAGAAIGSVVSHGEPGAIAAGTVIGAVVGNGLAR